MIRGVRHLRIVGSAIRVRGGAPLPGVTLSGYSRAVPRIPSPFHAGGA